MAVFQTGTAAVSTTIPIPPLGLNYLPPNHWVLHAPHPVAGYHWCRMPQPTHTGLSTSGNYLWVIMTPYESFCDTCILGSEPKTGTVEEQDHPFLLYPKMWYLCVTHRKQLLANYCTIPTEFVLLCKVGPKDSRCRVQRVGLVVTYQTGPSLCICAGSMLWISLHFQACWVFST